MANSEPKVIRANQFVLEDDNGKTRAVLDVGKDGVPGLYLYDDNGTPRAMLGVSKGGSVLALCDKNGRGWEFPSPASARGEGATRPGRRKTPHVSER